MKPSRHTKKAVLMVGEGSTEKAFLQYLKELYVTRDDDVAVKIECGAGGSPNCVIQKAKRLCGSMAYDECFVLTDADRLQENDCKIKHTKKIKVLKATPCIEGLFLAILQHPDFSQVSASCVLIESEIKIKNDGPILAYEVQLNGKEYKPLVPDWVKTQGEKAGCNQSVVGFFLKRT